MKNAPWFVVVLAAIGLFSGLAAPASGAEMTGSYVSVPNGRLWVIDSGGSNVPVILLHSNTGTVDRWAEEWPALVAAGYRVIAFDRRGSGKSTTNPGAQPGSVTEDLESLVESLKLASFHLVGEAGGGYVALDYAAWHPEKVKSLVVAASGAAMTDDESLAFRARAAIPGFRTWPIEARELSPTYRGLNPDGTAKWLAIEQHAPRGAASNPTLRTPNTVAKIEAISAPALIMAGDVDLTTPPGAVLVWAQHLKSWQYLLISDAGHSVSWEQPEVFNRAVVGFLNRHR